MGTTRSYKLDRVGQGRARWENDRASQLQISAVRDGGAGGSFPPVRWCLPPRLQPSSGAARDHWRQYERSKGGRLNFEAQCKELTALRAAVDWIAAVPVNVQQQALRDLDKAFANFFAGRAGYPTPRRKGEHDAFRFPAIHCGELRQINAKWSVIRLRGLGDVRVRTHRLIEGKPLSITVTLEGGRWFASFACEIERAEPPAPLPRAVGIDRGVARTLTLSTGGTMSLDRERLNVLDRRARKAQRTLSRRKRGSRRYGRARLAVARLKTQAARYRKDWNHKASYNIAGRFGVVALEKLKTANMTRSAAGTVEAPGRNVKAKAGLNRSILAQGWYQFSLFLGYKLEERGGHLVEVDPAHTSQTCSACGHISPDNRTTQARFACVSCQSRLNADYNAALNILGRLQWADVERGIGPALKREATGRKAPKTLPQGGAQLLHTHTGELLKRKPDQKLTA
jgi:putative transposase